MTVPDTVKAEASPACSACGGPLDALGKCQQCQAVFRTAYRCPLCQALSDLEPSALLTWACRTCGGPRIPPTAGPSPESEVALLQAARREQLCAGAFRAGSGFALGAGLLTFLVTNVVLLATQPPPLGKAFALLAGVVPLVLAFFAFRRANAHKRNFTVALDQAWLSAAGRVRQAEPNTTAATLARALRLDESRAELLLAELGVVDLLATDAPIAERLRVTELAEPEQSAPVDSSPTHTNKL